MILTTTLNSHIGLHELPRVQQRLGIRCQPVVGQNGAFWLTWKFDKSLLYMIQINNGQK